MSPGPTLPFLVKNNSNRFDIKNKEANEWGWEKKTQLSGFVIKNRLIKFETEYNVGSFFVCFVFVLWVFEVFYTSLVESPTNFKQGYANYVSLYSHSHTLPTAQWQLLPNEERITPFQR